MADWTNSTQPTSPNSNVDLTGFIQAYKIGPVLQAKALRDQMDLAKRNAERVYEKVHGLPTAQQKAEDDVIQVDSPTTNITHHHPPVQTLGTLAKIGLAFAISGPIGAGIAALPLIQSLINRPIATPASKPEKEAENTLYDLRLGHP